METAKQNLLDHIDDDIVRDGGSLLCDLAYKGIPILLSSSRTPKIQGHQVQLLMIK